MEMRTLTHTPPSLSRHQNQAAPPMFFSDLGVLPNLISGAERGAVEEEMEQNAEEGEEASSRKDERREDEK